LLFKSAKFGDDIDRALKKNDDTWTYFASDIAYHAHKIDRNFDVLINILGADHAGYIKRIIAAVRAISDDKINLAGICPLQPTALNPGASQQECEHQLALLCSIFHDVDSCG